MLCLLQKLQREYQETLFKRKHYPLKSQYKYINQTKVTALMTNLLKCYSSLTLQFYFKNPILQESVETIEFDSKGELLYHDCPFVPNVCLVRLDIKYVVLTQGIITDNICCKYKYEDVLQKLKLIFKINPYILTYIRNGHIRSLSLHANVCKDCKSSSNNVTYNNNYNLELENDCGRANLQIKNTRKVIVDQVVVPTLDEIEVPKLPSQTDIEDNIPTNVIVNCLPQRTILLQMERNQKVNVIMPMERETPKAIQVPQSRQLMNQVSYLETASTSIPQHFTENNSLDEIHLPKITEVFTLQECNKTEDNGKVDVKDEIDIEEHEITTGEGDQIIII